MNFFNTKDTNIETEKIWECFLCERKHPNTLRHCPVCNIAKIHSDNLRKTAEKKKNLNI